MCVKIRISLAEFMRSRTLLLYRGSDLRSVGTVTVDFLMLGTTRGFGRNRSEMVLTKKSIHSTTTTPFRRLPQPSAAQLIIRMCVWFYVLHSIALRVFFRSPKVCARTIHGRKTIRWLFGPIDSSVANDSGVLFAHHASTT
jgi:hypothetical protein